MPASTLSELLEGLTPEESAARKAEALAALLSRGVFTVGNLKASLERFATFTIDGVTVVVGMVFYDRERVQFVIRVSASDAAGALPVPTEFRFVNPPILVPDVDGNAKEDIAAAIQRFVYEAVVTWASNHGWTP
jgi:hypothetical protein